MTRPIRLNTIIRFVLRFLPLPRSHYSLSTIPNGAKWEDLDVDDAKIL